MTFKEFFDDVWQIQKHHVLLFEESDSDVVETWADENEDGLWKDIPAYTIVSIDAHHTDMCASDFLAEKWLKAEVTSLIILSGCVCVFLAPQNEASPTGAERSEE
jgi:hypothetical protein